MITSEQEYVEFLKELQESGNVVYTTIPSSEPRLYIDANTREISVSSKFPFLAVKHDHRAETIYFEINRYFDDVDLANHTCIIQYINKSKSGEVSEGYHYVQKMDIESVEGKIVFGWMIENPATKFSGDIVFSIRFYTIIGDKFDYNFNTKPACSTIVDTLQVCNADDYIYPSEFEIWVSKIDDIVDDIAESERYLAKTINDTEMYLEKTIKKAEENLDKTISDATTNIGNLLEQTTQQKNIATQQATVSTEKSVVATEQATIATNKATVATEQATISTNKATIATDKANVATTQAGIATEKANTATENALEAIEQAEIATTQAGIATEKANLIMSNINLASEKATVATEKASIATAQAEIATTQAGNASRFANEIEGQSLFAQSYAVGGSGTRENEDVDNAKYYYEQSKTITESFEIATVDEIKTYLGI